MDDDRRQRLTRAGWTVGTTEEFLGLTAEEAAYVEMKLALAQMLAERRRAAAVTQAELAARVHSSQSRVAKMEHGDDSVSLDLLIRTLLASGVSRQEIAQALA